MNLGISFPIDWENIYLGERKLPGNRLNYRVKHISQASGQRNTSNVWKYGADLLFTEGAGAKDIKIWLCKACHLNRVRSSAYRVSTTAHIASHLLRKHKIDVEDGSYLPETPISTNPWQLARAGLSSGESHQPWREEALLNALIDWVILQDISFSNATSAEFRGIISWNRTALLTALPAAPSTLSLYVKSTLIDRKIEIRKMLEGSLSKISLSADVWTSPNHYSFLGVVAHFIDAKSAPRDVLIGFKNLLGDYTGTNLSLAIAQVVLDYEIASKFNCFVGDNATNNDSALISSLQEFASLGIDPDKHRIRCAGHIINLVVKAFIYGKGVSKFELELSRAAPREQFELYRKRGIVGKLHNFVNAVLSSHKRRELFTGIQKEMSQDDPLWSFGTLQLVQDGGIRWNSVYFMLLRCFELKEAIQTFTRRWREKGNKEIDEITGYDPLGDAISDEDWYEVKQLIGYLKPFHEMTVRLEGNMGTSGYGSLWQTLVNLQHLYHRLEGKDPQIYYQISTFC